jgi:hypothetical protein
VLPGEDLTTTILTELATGILALNERLKTLDEQIEQTFKQHPQATIIQSMPGFAPFVGAALLVGAGGLARRTSSRGRRSTLCLQPAPEDRSGVLFAASFIRSGDSMRPERLVPRPKPAPVILIPSNLVEGPVPDQAPIEGQCAFFPGDRGYLDGVIVPLFIRPVTRW